MSTLPAASAVAQDFPDTQRMVSKVLQSRQAASEQQRAAERRRILALDQRSQAQAAQLQEQAAAVQQLGGELQLIREERQLIDLAGAFDAALAAGRWPAARAYLADEVAVDLGGAPAPTAATVPADALVADLSKQLARGGVPPRSNQHAQVDVERATLTSDGYAWGAAGRASARFGQFEYRFRRVAASWKIDGLVFRPATTS